MNNYGNRSSYPGSRYGDLYQSNLPNQDFNPVDQIGPALDTTQPRPPLNAPAVPTAPGSSQTPAAAPTTIGAGSPELAGLQHSLVAPMAPAPAAAPAVTPAVAPMAPPVVAAPAAVAPTAPAIPAYLQPLIDAIPGLAAPLTMESPEMVAQTNQLTRANQRGTDIAAEQLREKMAGITGGLMAPGESGLADTALGSIYRGGATDTATQLGEIARGLPGLNLSRIVAGGQLGEGLAGTDLANQQFTYQQQMDALNYLMSLYGGEQNAQQAQWSPYYSGIVGAYGG